MLDVGLIRKYAVAGPRYTSYPAATVFSGDFGAAEGRVAVVEDNAGAGGGAGISVYVHVPFCEQLCWYCGCNMVVERRGAAGDFYLDGLEKEMALTAALMAKGRVVEQLHLGGGTPTFLSAGQLRRLGGMLRKFWTIGGDAEVSVEVDPRCFNEEQAAALGELGMNRASIGVQDTNETVQRAVHRVQPMGLNVRAVELLRAAGVKSVNVDLIYGLPGQTRESFAWTMEEVLEGLRPERLSVFSYAHVPWMRPAQKLVERAVELPSAEEKLGLFALAHERLVAAGFVDVGLDHFAKPEDELAVALKAGTLHRNFQGYSTRGGMSLYGFGVSSISATEGTYRQNFKDMAKWRAALEAGELPVERGYRLTEEDRKRRAMVMGIMCERRMDFEKMSKRLGVEVPVVFAREIASLGDLEADGIVRVDAKGLEVTEVGAPLLRVVAMRFDGHFRPDAAVKRHAVTV